MAGGNVFTFSQQHITLGYCGETGTLHGLCLSKEMDLSINIMCSERLRM